MASVWTIVIDYKNTTNLMMRMHFYTLLHYTNQIIHPRENISAYLFNLSNTHSI